MQDRETGTLWSHVTGQALHGPLAGERLDIIASVQTSWREWVARHPDTRVLRKETPVRGSRDEAYARDPSRFGVFRGARAIRKLPGKSIMCGIARGREAVAVAGSALEGAAFLDVDVGGEAILLARGRDGGVRAVVPRAGARELRFRREGPDGHLRDEDTGSTWEAETGRCLEGPLAGSAIEEIPVRPAYWFAWVSFFPDSRVADRPPRRSGGRDPGPAGGRRARPRAPTRTPSDSRGTPRRPARWCGPRRGP